MLYSDRFIQLGEKRMVSIIRRYLRLPLIIESMLRYSIMIITELIMFERKLTGVFPMLLALLHSIDGGELVCSDGVFWSLKLGHESHVRALQTSHLLTKLSL